MAKPVGSMYVNDSQLIFGRMPVLLAMDHSVGNVSETVVEGQAIACFDIGGEKRLCLPQILNSILCRFTLPQINVVFEELQIFSSLCTDAQLIMLKRQKVLPSSARTCGLITKTNAERLCSLLLHHHGSVTNQDLNLSPSESIRVSHECFGKCKGMFLLELYVSATSQAICCCDCLGMFSPPEFVCHSHHLLQNRICHWGFDSVNWKYYLTLSKDNEDDRSAKQLLDYAKGQFDEKGTYKRKQCWSVCINKGISEKRSRLEITNEKLGREQNDIFFNSCHPMLWRTPSKDSKTEEESSEVCWSSLPFLLKDFPILQHPDRVVPFNQFNRYDKSFEPNVALAPTQCEKQEEHNKSKNTDEVKEESIDKRYSLHIQNGYDEIQAAIAKCNKSGTLNESCLEMEVFHIFNMELDIFQRILDEEKEENKKQLLKDFHLLQRCHKSIFMHLQQTQKALQKKLIYVNDRTMNALSENASNNEIHKKQLISIKMENKSSLEKIKEENQLLCHELETLMNTSRRSDTGLMKAKYKAQVEHFRRKLWSVDKINSQLLPQLRELQSLVRQDSHSTSMSSSSSSLMSSNS